MTAVHKRANAKRAEIDRTYRTRWPCPKSCAAWRTLPSSWISAGAFPIASKRGRVTAIWPNNTRLELRLHCFANRADAEEFANHFEGEHFNPKKDRGKGKDRHVWRRSGEWQHKDQTGPLKMPRFFRKTSDA